jgi:hypothetical protein
VDVTLQCGQTYTINSTVAATAATGLTYRWLENGGVVTGAAANYTVIGKSVGVYTYIRQAQTTGCTDWQNSNAFTVEVKNKEGIDGVCFGGVMWAKYDVDEPGTFAATSDAPGKLYQFNRKTPYPTSGPIIWSDNLIVEDIDWIPENDPCPIGWRLPTYAEVDRFAYTISHVTELNPSLDKFYSFVVYAGGPRAANLVGNEHSLTMTCGCRYPPDGEYHAACWLRSSGQTNAAGTHVIAFAGARWWVGGDSKSNARTVRCVHD